MVEIAQDFLFFVNLVAVFLITLSCLKIAYRWKKRKSLSTNFFSLGFSYSLVFIFLSYWNYTQSLFALIVGTILLFAWVLLLSVGSFAIVFPRKSLLNYTHLIYVLVPFITLITRSIKLTFIAILDLSGFIILFTFTKLMLFGKKPIKIASVFGFVAGLASVFYSLIVLIGMNIPIYSSLLIDVFLAISFGGFWYVSNNSPDNFLNKSISQENGS